MTSRAPASSNVTLPSIRTIFPPSTFSRASSSPLSDDEMPMPVMPLTQQKLKSHDKSFQIPRLHLPLPTPRHNHGRRVSTASNYSVPSLTHSPSPSPSPPPHRVRLVPCDLETADVVLVASPPSLSSAKPRATLLVGPAVSRAAAAKDERKMHPYRVVRDRRA